jgi:hypothetical protein
MPALNPDLVPTINPGQLFSRLTTDVSLAIRWLVATDPAYFDNLNRPTADVAIRQLIIAKTLDTINLRLGHQALFPFVIQPRVIGGTVVTDVPLGWIWDMHPSMPKKWEDLRLAKIKRVAGLNPGSGSDYTGKLRLVFTANEVGSATEVSIFQVDYIIDSDLTYQIMPISVPTSSEESQPLSPGESETVAGWVTFRTMDLTDATVQAFLDVLEPPVGTEDSSGEYPNPTVYEIQDSDPGGPQNPSDFDILAMSHGSGLLTLSAWNPIPQLDSDVETWLLAFNYPFGETASLQSVTHPTIFVPFALFKEFNVVAPASDEPTGDASGNYFPVWLSAIERLDAEADNLRFYFSTYAVTPKTTSPIEFATLDLNRDFTEDRLVPILASEHLFPAYEDNDDFVQGFGLGFVVLSRKWGVTSSEIDIFFDLFKGIIESPPKIAFSKDGGRVSSYGISRVPQTIPTLGQWEALFGTKHPDFPPNENNRFIVDKDQGLGDAVDFRVDGTLPPDKRNNPDIEPIGYTGALAHRVVRLVINSAGQDHDYTDDILPRLQILLGRAPAFGDFWYDGTRLKFFNGDTWQG